MKVYIIRQMDLKGFCKSLYYPADGFEVSLRQTEHEMEPIVSHACSEEASTHDMVSIS